MNLKMTIERPIGAAAMLALLLAAAGLILAMEIADLSSVLAERDAKAEFVTRSLRTARSAQADGASARLAMTAETETLAAADLDALIRSTVADAGGAVMSSQTEAKHDEPGPHGRIEAQITVEGSIEAMQKALFHLENGAPLVTVDEISLQPAESAPTADADAQPPVRSPALHATIRLSSYWAAPGR